MERIYKLRREVIEFGRATATLHAALYCRIASLPMSVLVTMNTTLKIVAAVSVLAQATAAAAVLFPKR